MSDNKQQFAAVLGSNIPSKVGDVVQIQREQDDQPFEVITDDKNERIELPDVAVERLIFSEEDRIIIEEPQEAEDLSTIVKQHSFIRKTNNKQVTKRHKANKAAKISRRKNR